MRTYRRRERFLFGLLGAAFAGLPVLTVVLAIKGQTHPILWAAAVAAMAVTSVSAKIVVTGTLWGRDPDLRRVVGRVQKDRDG